MKLDLQKIEKALDAGKLEMQRPWGDWVPVTRRGPTQRYKGSDGRIPIRMEADVETSITGRQARFGFAGVRIAA